MTLLGILASAITGNLTPPIPVAGYKLWLDATDAATITAIGGAVSQWNDKSGNLYNFTQATGANQPTTNSRTINSKNVIDFDGTTDSMSVASSSSLFKYLHSSTGGTTFVVGVIDDDANTKVIFSTCDFASAHIGVVTQGTIDEKTTLLIARGVGGATTAISSETNQLTAGNGFYLTTKFDGGNATAGNRLLESLNNGAFAGLNVVTNAASSANSTGNLTLGREAVTAAGFFNGGIGEVIFYEGILSGGNIDLVEAYLAAKWGI